ncbi:hypothetical protein [Bradyrhizobium sp. DASA03120]|uniref:hypothetical protein n=2 Tax=unclassified Bradyrhizobium TaxID=2631580 RepID=UPI003F72753A
MPIIDNAVACAARALDLPIKETIPYSVFYQERWNALPNRAMALDILVEQPDRRTAMGAPRLSVSSVARSCDMPVKSLIAATISLMLTASAIAQALPPPPPPPEMPPDGPILEMVAGMVIQKYKSSSCEDLKAKKGEPPAEIVGAAVAFLRDHPSVKVKFINKVAAPVANRMFDCGMIP